MIHLYTGNGGGKTTSALGVALRAVGQGQKVIVIQFMKGRKDIGEYKIQKKLKNLEVYQFGRKEFIDLSRPTTEDRELAKKGLEFIKEAVKKKPKVLILDEINLATRIRLLDLRDVIKVIKEIPIDIHIYLTGRYAPRALLRISDFVTRVEDIKRPKEIIARKGIDY